MPRNERYYVFDHSYDASEDALTLDLDCPERDRCYRVTWQPEHLGAPMRVLAHWEFDCIESAEPLPRAEEDDLERWLDASDDVAELLEGYRRDERGGVGVVNITHAQHALARLQRLEQDLSDEDIEPCSWCGVDCAKWTLRDAEDALRGIPGAEHDCGEVCIGCLQAREQELDEAAHAYTEPDHIEEGWR